MNKRTLLSILPAAALLLLSACTQDEPGGQGNELPYGEYPLQIGGVTLDVESSAESWSAEGPQTRVAENDNGTGSVWQWNGSEMIGVRLGNETATYTLNADKNLITDRQLYWTSTAPTTVTAWYPTDETVNLSDQSEGLAYMLKAEVPGATYDNKITLSFKHQLAKVRVVLSGTQASQVNAVEVYGITACNHLRGSLDYNASNTGWIKMKKQTYGNTECWEANVVPGEVISQIKVNDTEATLTVSLTPKVAALNTIDLTVGEKITDINKDNTTINDNGYYRVSGTFNQQINITGGKPTIYLEGASINVGNGPAINITSGTPTIHVTGENTIETSKSLFNCSSGIYVAQGSSVTIEGTGTDDVLRVTGGTDGAAIGGYYDSGDKPCGDIVIKNVTLHAYAGESYSSAFAPGIGATGGTCGRIEISSAIVHARSNGDIANSAPAIGAYGSVPEIVITDSEIHAYRGSYDGTSYADYIGRGGSKMDYQGGQIQCGSGSITGSTVYKYTYNYSNKSSSSDGREAY